jgi:hypothetical protein
MAELKMWQLWMGTLIVGPNTPATTRVFTNPESRSIQIKIIEPRFVGADGLTGELAMWLSRSPSGVAIYSRGIEMYSNPNTDPSYPLYLGNDYITLTSGEQVTFSAQGLLMAGQTQHSWVPILNLYYI